MRAHIRTWLASASRFMQFSHKIHEIICFIFHVSQKYGLAAPIFAQNHYTEGLYCWNWKTEKKNIKRILLLNCKKKKKYDGNDDRIKSLWQNIVHSGEMKCSTHETHSNASNDTIYIEYNIICHPWCLVYYFNNLSPLFFLALHNSCFIHFTESIQQY